MSGAAESVESRPGHPSEPSAVVPLRPAAQADASSQAWAAFTSASDDAGFHAAWLALQCGAIPGVLAALLLLRESANGAYAPAALWPDAQRNLEHLGGVARRALAERRGVIAGIAAEDREGIVAGTVQVALPIESADDMPGVVVLELRLRPQAELQDVLRQLIWGAGWLQARMRRGQLEARTMLLERASTALDLLQVVQQNSELAQSAMAFVNELATVVRADRVSLGVERKSGVRMLAMSRTAWFDPRSQLVDTIERTMEEAVDQEAWIVHPPSERSRGHVTLAHRELANHAGSAAVLTVPVNSGGRTIGALTVERVDGPPFDEAAIALCEAACALAGPALQVRMEGDRWFAGRLSRLASQGRDRLLGTGHQGFKAGAVLAVLVFLVLVFARTDFRVSARTAIEGAVQRAAVAPFDGYIHEAHVRAGETVRQGSLLASMDDRDLRLDRAKWESEREQVARKYAEALAKRERASAGIIAAQLSQADSQLALAEDKLSRTKIVAPFDGIVVSGDLSQMLGAPVEKGKVLFELAPLDRYRVVLRVDERDIGFVTAGQQGELALAGVSGDVIPFVVKNVTPVSTAQEGRNYFRVEAQLDEASPRLRPGMEGVGKVSIGTRSLLWIWTRHFVSWVRLTFWSWTP